MKKKIHIVSIANEWMIFSNNGEKISGCYRTPNQALQFARPLAQTLGAEIVIYTREQSHKALQADRRRRFRQRKSNSKKV